MLGNWTRELRVLLFAYLFLLAKSPLSAQEGGYHLERLHNGGARFMQRLAWRPERYVLRYEVVIEREGRAGYEEALREYTGASFIEVSLAPGRYRYRVRVYDLLDLPGEASEWTAFSILQALEPELRSFSPVSFYLDEGNQWVLNLSGRNLTAEAEVYLRLPGSGTPAIKPLEYTSAAGGNRARLVFGFQQLEPGRYEVYIKNPGGLDASRGGFAIVLYKGRDLYISAAYAPLLPLYGELNQLFGQSVYPLGGAARLRLIPFKRPWGFLGMELGINWHYAASRSDAFTVSFHAPGSELNLLFQQWFSNRAAAYMIRAGAALGTAVDYHFTYPQGDGPSTHILFPQGVLGVSLFWFMRKPFFIEAGLDYVHWFTTDTVAPGYARPHVGLGWRF
jgi:hypothetical protein